MNSVINMMEYKFDKTIPSVITQNDEIEDHTTIEVMVPKGYRAQIKVIKLEEGTYYNRDKGPYKDLKKILNGKVLKRSDYFSFDDALNGTVSSELTGKNILGNEVSCSEYDIINKEMEVVGMNAFKLHMLLQKQISFLLFSLLFIIGSFIAMAVYYRTGLYIIHPILYVFTLLMGVGWMFTSLYSVMLNGRIIK